MTDEKLKELVEEYRQGLGDVEEVKREYNEKFENLSEEDFDREFSKQLDAVLQDAKNHPIKTKQIKK